MEQMFAMQQAMMQQLQQQFGVQVPALATSQHQQQSQQATQQQPQQQPQPGIQGRGEQLPVRQEPGDADMHADAVTDGSNSVSGADRVRHCNLPLGDLLRGGGARETVQVLVIEGATRSSAEVTGDRDESAKTIELTGGGGRSPMRRRNVRRFKVLGAVATSGCEEQDFGSAFRSQAPNVIASDFEAFVDLNGGAKAKRLPDRLPKVEFDEATVWSKYTMAEGAVPEKLHVCLANIESWPRADLAMTSGAHVCVLSEHHLGVEAAKSRLTELAHKGWSGHFACTSEASARDGSGGVAVLARAPFSTRQIDSFDQLAPYVAQGRIAASRVMRPDGHLDCIVLGIYGKSDYYHNRVYVDDFWTAISAWIAARPRQQIVLAGDFNVERDECPCAESLLLDGTLVDLVAMGYLSDELIPATHKKGRQLDHCWATPEFAERFRSAFVADEYVTDHKLVHVEMAMERHPEDESMRHLHLPTEINLTKEQMAEMQRLAGHWAVREDAKHFQGQLACGDVDEALATWSRRWEQCLATACEQQLPSGTRGRGGPVVADKPLVTSACEHQDRKGDTLEMRQLAKTISKLATLEWQRDNATTWEQVSCRAKNEQTCLHRLKRLHALEWHDVEDPVWPTGPKFDLEAQLNSLRAVRSKEARERWRQSMTHPSKARRYVKGLIFDRTDFVIDDNRLWSRLP
eukprot:2177765-Amphidinium_carterae.1